MLQSNRTRLIQSMGMIEEFLSVDRIETLRYMCIVVIIIVSVKLLEDSIFDFLVRAWARILEYPRLFGLQVVMAVLLFSGGARSFLQNIFPAVFDGSMYTVKNAMAGGIALYIVMMLREVMSQVQHSEQESQKQPLSQASVDLERWLLHEKDKREKIFLRKRVLTEHLIDLTLLQTIRDNGSLTQQVLSAMADIFEKEIKDKDDRRELALYLISNNAAVIEQKVLHPHLSKTDKTDRWPLFRELCRSVRIPCCECDDFAISVYHSGLCGDIVRILENDYLMNNYENDKILLDLVGLGLLICTVCSGNISPATEGETKTLRDITTFYLLSNVEKVKQAATMLSQIVEAAEKEKEGTKRRRKKSSKVMHDNDANKEKPDKTTSEVNSRKEPVQRMIQKESIHSNQDNETKKNTDSKPLKVFTQRQVSTVTTKDTRHASNAKIIEASGVVTNQSDVTENNTNTITKVSSNEDNTSENHVQLVRRDSKRHSLLRKLSFSKGKKS